MRDILAAENVELLAQFAWSRVLLAFDFDGTLAPIVADRDAAQMRSRTRALFDRVCKLYPTAVISGRDDADISKRVVDSPVRHVVGNHGVGPAWQSSTFQMQVAMIYPELANALMHVPGVEVEAKRASVAVHYRRARRSRDARRAIDAAVARLSFSMRSIPGKRVVNLIPLHAQSKGDALQRLRDEEGADTAIYVGDDTTDEDVFALDQPGRLLSIRVGRSTSSAAPYYLQNQRRIDALLSHMTKLRVGSIEP
jgi:trehalose 6-phosphate phosphatase